MELEKKPAKELLVILVKEYETQLLRVFKDAKQGKLLGEIIDSNVSIDRFFKTTDIRMLTDDVLVTVYSMYETIIEYAEEENIIVSSGWVELKELLETELFIRIGKQN